MLTIFTIMIAGIAIGYAFSRQTQWAKNVVMPLICLLLLLLGMEVGSNDRIMQSWTTIGMDALLITFGTVGGSVIAARLLYNFTHNSHPSAISSPSNSSSDSPSPSSPDSSSPPGGIRGGLLSLLGRLRGGLSVLLLFLLGLLLTAFTLLPTLPIASVSFYTLCLLMFCVGMTIGNDRDMLRRFRTINPRLALLPLFTVAGTLAGALAVSALLPRHSAPEVLAIGSGLGYYSLSSILITDTCGAEAGTIALVSNIMRELITLLCAPLLARFFGPFAPIASGGATTADTTLPVIVQASGSECTILSVYHGCATDFCVPFLVTFFCSL